MCQAGESPDNECQYHYHNFNVAIFHPLTTLTFFFLRTGCVVLAAHPHIWLAQPTFT